MRILEIENLFKSKETLDKALEFCKADIEMIDYWSDIRKTGITDNSEEINKALNQLSGCYANLKTVLGVAESEKKNREVRHYEELKINATNSDKKFTSAVAERESSSYVAPYRRVRNIIEAYVESADKHIVTLQSILKDLGKDYGHPQG